MKNSLHLFQTHTLTLRKGKRTIRGWAAPLKSFCLVSGKEEFLLVARSQAGLVRQLSDLCPDVKIKPKAFLKVEVTL
ncbi:MAG: hypothetical protein KGL39_47735 [Patescibacteria group bacterium]|nr:hypothetical protein [Patescibacteria group bacterium]